MLHGHSVIISKVYYTFSWTATEIISENRAERHEKLSKKKKIVQVEFVRLVVDRYVFKYPAR